MSHEEQRLALLRLVASMTGVPVRCVRVEVHRDFDEERCGYYLTPSIDLVPSVRAVAAGWRLSALQRAMRDLGWPIRVPPATVEEVARVMRAKRHAQTNDQKTREGQDPGDTEEDEGSSEGTCFTR